MNKKNIFVFTSVILVIVCFTLGAYFLATTDDIILKEQHFNYTNCKVDHADEELTKLTCPEFFKKYPSNPACSCAIYFEIYEDMKDEVKLYSELETYDQNIDDYKNSRDNEQLSGHLGPVAASCGNFSYDDGKPVAPCGAVADSFFTDAVFLYHKIDEEYTEFPPKDYLATGLLTAEQKAGYKNPPGDLKTALQNYTKPKSWSSELWELDTNEENNGFQNERFIAWMTTDLKRKPIWRVPAGLKAGKYQLAISYNRRPLGYKGERKLILQESSYHRTTWKIVVGSLLLVLSAICLILLVWSREYIKKCYVKKETAHIAPVESRLMQTS